MVESVELWKPLRRRCIVSVCLVRANDSGHVRPSLRVVGRWKAEVFAGFSMAWSCSSDIDNTGNADSANCPALDFLQGMSLGAQSACSNFC